MSGQAAGSWGCSPRRSTTAGASRCCAGGWMPCARVSGDHPSRRDGRRPGWNSTSWPIRAGGRTGWRRSCGAPGGAGTDAARMASGTCCAARASSRARSAWGSLPATRPRPSRGPADRSPSATSRRRSRATWCSWIASMSVIWRAPAGAPGNTPPLMSPRATPGPRSTTPRAIPPRAIPRPSPSRSRRPWPATAGSSSASAPTTPASSPAPPSPSRPGGRALRGVPGSRAWAACDEQGRRAFPAPPAPRPFAVVTKTRSSLPR